MSTTNKTSLLIPFQLPEFIRDDPSYNKFVLFLQAYYEWMEETNNVSDRSKNLLNYNDIDKTSSEFLEYYYNEFLPYFPKEILADKVKVTKIARELYKSKGTPASYKFLFRVLFNSDVDFFYTKDAVLRASSGKWYVTKSLRLLTTDENFLNIDNLRLFGESTKSIATVETSVVSGNKIEVFISNIERLFQSGEFVRVVDANNQDVLFNGSVLRAKLVGQISGITINPKNRGSIYRPGDPVIVYGALGSVNGHGASAQVGTVTSGSIQRILVDNGGYGYTAASPATPNTIISIINGGGALAAVGGVVTNANTRANVTMIPSDVISLKTNIKLGNTTNLISYNFSANSIANFNTPLANAFNMSSFSTYPISSIIVQNGGGGLSVIPSIIAESLYPTEYNLAFGNLKNLGILGPIQILNGGVGYVANDKINIIGGGGYGAYANVSTVASNGAITAVSYVYRSNTIHDFPLGGLGYTSDTLPALTVTSANAAASNAALYVPGILGDGAAFTVSTDRVGAITTIQVNDYGEDYIGTPNISLRVQDMVVKNLASSNLPKLGDVVYQGTDVSVASYTATVNSIAVLSSDIIAANTLYLLQVFNYSSIPNYNLPLKIDSGIPISMNLTNSYTPVLDDSRYDANTGIKIYGDGTAKATAKFLNGLTIGQGQFLDSSGQPSSFDVLQSVDYNNYTYEITLEKEIAKYRTTLLNLLHPTGMKVIGRYAMKSNSSLSTTVVDAMSAGKSLSYYTGTHNSTVSLGANFTNQSNNIITFSNLSGANLSNIVFANTSSIKFTTSNNDYVTSQIIAVNPTANTVTLKDNVWLTFANVAYGSANINTNIINILLLTNSYNIVNNGSYSNTQYPLKDIIRAGDVVLIANNTQKTVSSVNYLTNVVTLTSNLTANANSLVSVSRTLTASGDNILIFGPVGAQYYPEVTTESGYSITTEDNTLILID